MSRTVLITGVAGLVGSACARHFHPLGWNVVGLDNDARADYFGPEASTRSVLAVLRRDLPGLGTWGYDIRDRKSVRSMVDSVAPDLVIHAAAQPSHDWAAANPFEDFEVNAGGTLNLLEATRRHAPDAVFIFLSTNKVYGDTPNRMPLVELPTRFDYLAESQQGVGEWMSIDSSTHSLFGCSKLAADLYTQEYGRYFGLKTVSLRCGCLTGAAHAGAEQHGFLAYLAKCCREGKPYKIYGHKGKQVRDNLHASDVARACEEIVSEAQQPLTPGSVYNLGGGRDNSCSVFEAIAAVERRCNKQLAWEYVQEARKGDHLVWITDNSKFKLDYPDWSVRVSLGAIFDELCRPPK